MVGPIGSEFRRIWRIQGWSGSPDPFIPYVVYSLFLHRKESFILFCSGFVTPNSVLRLTLQTLKICLAPKFAPLRVSQWPNPRSSPLTVLDPSEASVTPHERSLHSSSNWMRKIRKCSTTGSAFRVGVPSPFL